jgi:hypothetical protein
MALLDDGSLHILDRSGWTERRMDRLIDPFTPDPGAVS